MDIQDLMTVLKIFYDNKDSTETFSESKLNQIIRKIDDPKALLKKHRNINTTIIINKLMEDGFLFSKKTEMDDPTGIGIKEYDYYYISYEGIIFYESGGYRELENRKKRNRDFLEGKRNLELKQIESTTHANKSVIKVNRLFWVILIFSFLGAIGTLGTFSLELYKLSRTPLQKTQKKQTNQLIKEPSSLKNGAVLPSNSKDTSHNKDTSSK